MYPWYYPSFLDIIFRLLKSRLALQALRDFALYWNTSLQCCPLSSHFCNLRTKKVSRFEIWRIRRMIIDVIEFFAFSLYYFCYRKRKFVARDTTKLWSIASNYFLPCQVRNNWVQYSCVLNRWYYPRITPFYSFPAKICPSDRHDEIDSSKSNDYLFPQRDLTVRSTSSGWCMFLLNHPPQELAVVDLGH